MGRVIAAASNSVYFPLKKTTGCCLGSVFGWVPPDETVSFQSQDQAFYIYHPYHYQPMHSLIADVRAIQSYNIMQNLMCMVIDHDAQSVSDSVSVITVV